MWSNVIRKRRSKIRGIECLTMTKINLYFVQAFCSKGRRYYYFRRRGEKRIKLPGLPGSKEFMEAYSIAVGRTSSNIGASKHAKGSVAALIGKYFETSHFKEEIGEHTRCQIRQGLNKFREEFGANPVALLERKHLAEILAKLKP